MNLIEIEQGNSLLYYKAYLNNTRALIKLFDALIYKEQFILLPGDEIVEKKHKNVKHLMAMAMNTDLSKNKTRKYPGLGPNVFKVDFEKRFAAVYGPPPQTSEYNSRVGTAAERVDEEVEPNEINTEIEILNTVNHKAIVKARNENYVVFRQRF